jgi:fructose-1,6-bisphosphatase-3
MSTLPSHAPAQRAPVPDPTTLDEQTLVYLRALSAQYRTIDDAVAAISNLQAVLTLEKGTIHVISDIHGEWQKLTHVINNASGSLRPLVDELFAKKLTEAERLELVNLIYYPRETWDFLSPQLKTCEERCQFLRRNALHAIKVVRCLTAHYNVKALDRVYPKHYKILFRELLGSEILGRTEEYVYGLLDTFVMQGRELALLTMLAHLIRNLLISELIIAGDFGDRGARIDKVIDFVMHQPNVAITWGNHDASWMGACLGDELCIATVMRISMRYQRLFQLEMGYGIPVASVERLVRQVYPDDPAERFPCRGSGIRDALAMARMQKAMAIIELKLQGQTIRRNPDFNLEHRNLLHRIDPKTGTVTIDGRTCPMLDIRFPTIDWSDPYRLSPEEQECMAQLKLSFLQSQKLWDHMRFLEQRGSMHLIRDFNLIYHGCIPVDEEGNFLPMKVDGVEFRGLELYEALNHLVHKAFREREQRHLDMMWYLWCGPLSPLFGKDKVATFETYFIADEATHLETKNPYFQLIHEKEFCRKILEEFSVDREHGLIVNGHVPVKVEKGESPVKKSGQAVTIDGAFSEVYGDRGYTLILESDGTHLALHHHFESVTEAITQGADIIPKIETICRFDPPRHVRDTSKGRELRLEIAALQLLIRAYEEHVVHERDQHSA